MIMKSVITTIICLLATISLSAQSLERQVIGSGGQFADQASGSLSFTVGEAVTLSAVHQDAQLTQGFQQETGQGTTSAPAAKDLTVSLIVFPNPATDVLKINSDLYLKGIATLSYSILDLQGREVFSGTVVSDGGSIDLSSLAASGYVIRLYSADHSFDQRLRFVKT